MLRVLLKAQSSQLLHSQTWLLCRGFELCSFSILADSTLLYRLIWAKLTDSTQQLCRIDRSSNSCEDWELSSLEIPADRMQRCWTALLRKNVQVPEIQYWECWGQNLIWAKLTASTQSDLRLLQWCPQAETRQNQHRRAHSQTQTDNQLRSISGQTVRDRAESVELFSLSKDQAEKMRYVEAKSDQYERSCACLKFNSILSRATSYELCRLIAQLVVIRFWSKISLFLRLVLTKKKALCHFSLRNFLLLEKWPQLKRIFCQIFSIWVPESKPLHSSQVTCEPRSCSDSD